MSTRDYLKMVLWEYVLCCLMALSLSITYYQGFNAPDNNYQQAFFVALGLVFALTALLFAIARDKQRALRGGIALGAVLLLAFVAAVLSQGTAVLSDEPGNFFIIVVVPLATTLACFLLSRTKPGAIILGVLGAFSCIALEFLYEDGRLAAMLVFVVAAISLVVYKDYRAGLRGSQTRTTAFRSVALTSAAAALLVMGASAAIWFGAIAPNVPDARELKLFTHYMAYEELPRRGTNAELAISNPDMTSTFFDEETQLAYENPDDVEMDTTESETSDESSFAQSVIDALGYALGATTDALTRLFNYITFETKGLGWLVLLLIVAALIAAPILFKRHRRKKFYESALAAPPRTYVSRLYDLFTKDLRRMKVSRRPNTTLFEFACDTEGELALFEDNEGRVSFLQLTDVYVRACYGKDPLTVEDLAAYQQFYQAFYRNAQSYLGRFAYCRKFFFL